MTLSNHERNERIRNGLDALNASRELHRAISRVWFLAEGTLVAEHCSALSKWAEEQVRTAQANLDAIFATPIKTPIFCEEPHDWTTADGFYVCARCPAVRGSVRCIHGVIAGEYCKPCEG